MYRNDSVDRTGTRVYCAWLRVITMENHGNERGSYCTRGLAFSLQSWLTARWNRTIRSGSRGDRYKKYLQPRHLSRLIHAISVRPQQYARWPVADTMNVMPPRTVLKTTRGPSPPATPSGERGFVVTIEGNIAAGKVSAPCIQVCWVNVLPLCARPPCSWFDRLTRALLVFGIR